VTESPETTTRSVWRQAVGGGLVVAVIASLFGAWSLHDSRTRRENVADQVRRLGGLVEGDLANVVMSPRMHERDLLRLLELLRECQAPESLRLDSCQVNAEVLESVGRMRWLTSLSLRETPVSDVDVAHLAPLSSLRSLDLQFTAVTEAGVNSLATLTSLEKLTVDPGMMASGLERLKERLPRLEIDATAERPQAPPEAPRNFPGRRRGRRPEPIGPLA